MKQRVTITHVAVIVAVLLAIGGTSYAAVVITGKDVKNGSLTGADVKNKSLTKKDFKGSVTGPAGPQGAPGAPGAQGVQGVQGPAGPFPDVLPSGKTLTGVFSVTGVATAPGQYADSPISFGFRFASAPTVVTVGIDDTPAEAAAAGCPGTAAEPKAAPGKVCLYEMGHENLDDAATGELEADGDAAWVSAYAPPDNNFGTATPVGTIVEALSSAAGNFYSNGTWAATSP